MKVNKINKAGLDLIKSFEGFSAKAYVDPATGGLPITIGYGSTRYSDGSKVKMTDPVLSMEAAEKLLADTMGQYELAVDAMAVDTLNANQFSALVSFCYNCGAGNLKSSTLLKKVNINPNDPTIAAEFAKWNKGAGKVLAGLTRRRKAEHELYFKPC
jgi:lysozyme